MSATSPQPQTSIAPVSSPLGATSSIAITSPRDGRPNENRPPEITRITLQVLSITLLILAAFWILQPFLPSILWSTIIVVTSWPLFLRVQKRLWNRRFLAIVMMISALLLIVILPCAIAIGAIISNTDVITEWANSVRQMELPPPPGFLNNIPMVGPRLVEGWAKAEALGTEGLTKYLAPYAGVVMAWFLSKAGSVGLLFVDFLFTLIFAAVLYAKGEAAAGIVRGFSLRLAGPRGDEVATLAAKAIRSVALGVVVTALVQAVLSGIGMALSGVPSAALLTAIIFVLCLCQVGPTPILIPAIVWLYWRGGLGSGTLLLVFALCILPLDNFLRPMLIRKGADIPFVLVFVGVIGGLIALGVIGLFVGPVVLAVVHTLLKSWIAGEPGLAVPEAKV
jgi:predicted PurR-regulated permease PerM